MRWASIICCALVLCFDGHSISLENQISQAAQQYRSAEKELQLIEEELEKSKESYKKQSATLKEQQQKIGKLIILLHTLQNEAPSRIIGSHTHGKDILHGMTVLGAYMRGLKRQIIEIQADIRLIEKSKKQVEDKRKLTLSRVEQYKEKKDTLETLLNAQKAKEKQKKEEEAIALKMASQSSNLKELIKTLEKNTKFPLKGAQATGLLLPAQGPIIAAYGKKHLHSPDGKGVVFRTRSGSYVLAPTTGQVLFAGPFRTYKNIVIIGFNKEHTVLMTGLGTIHVKVGKTVTVGDPIGRMDDGDKGYLYLEMRKNGTPLKPDILGIV